MRLYSSSIQEVISRVSLPRVRYAIRLSYLFFRVTLNDSAQALSQYAPSCRWRRMLYLVAVGSFGILLAGSGPNERWYPLFCGEVAHDRSFFCCADFDDPDIVS